MALSLSFFRPVSAPSSYLSPRAAAVFLSFCRPCRPLLAFQSKQNQRPSLSSAAPCCSSRLSDRSLLSRKSKDSSVFPLFFFSTPKTPTSRSHRSCCLSSPTQSASFPPLSTFSSSFPNPRLSKLFFLRSLSSRPHTFHYPSAKSSPSSHMPSPTSSSSLFLSKRHLHCVYFPLCLSLGLSSSLSSSFSVSSPVYTSSTTAFSSSGSSSFRSSSSSSAKEIHPFVAHLPPRTRRKVEEPEDRHWTIDSSSSSSPCVSSFLFHTGSWGFASASLQASAGRSRQEQEKQEDLQGRNRQVKQFEKERTDTQGTSPQRKARSSSLPQGTSRERKMESAASSKSSMSGFDPKDAGQAADVVLVPTLSDNYAYLLVDRDTKEAACVDPAEPRKVLDAAAKEGVNLKMCLCTHKHLDHSGGNLELADLRPDIEMVGSGYEETPGIRKKVKHGDTLHLGSLEIRVLHAPCHTGGHVLYLVTNTKDPSLAPILFTGDTLFVGGCGRFFEGTAEQMCHALLDVISKALPGNTRVYCGHEYTRANLQFALTVEPENKDLQEKYRWAVEQSNASRPTIPSSLDQEKKFNPFMRVEEKSVQRAVGSEGNKVETMRRLREMKNKS